MDPSILPLMSQSKLLSRDPSTIPSTNQSKLHRAGHRPARTEGRDYRVHAAVRPGVRLRPVRRALGAAARTRGRGVRPRAAVRGPRGLGRGGGGRADGPDVPPWRDLRPGVHGGRAGGHRRGPPGLPTQGGARGPSIWPRCFWRRGGRTWRPRPPPPAAALRDLPCGGSLWEALEAVRRDERLVLVGAVQSLFEACMYVFILQ